MNGDTATAITYRHAQLDKFLSQTAYDVDKIYNDNTSHDVKIDLVKSILFSVFKSGYDNRDVSLVEPSQEEIEAERQARASYEGMRALYGAGFVTDPNIK